ncbi:MAG TPA: TetR/AcrR family transcriptional regulator [Fimbriimonadaceae bacterium]|jgi:AcrR family transcriptional regulator
MSNAATALDTREAILDACDSIMARFGFRKMTMDDLAHEAHVSKRTIYHYFPSKEEVGLSSIGRVVEQVHAELKQIAEQPIPPEEKLKQMLIARVMGRVRQVKDYYHSLDELFEVVRPAYMERRNRYFAIELDLLQQVLEQGRQQATFHFQDPEIAARLLMLATNAFLPYSLSVKQLGEPEAIQERLTQMVELLINGLSHN